jgi:hypothetical protein
MARDRRSYTGEHRGQGGGSLEPDVIATGQPRRQQDEQGAGGQAAAKVPLSSQPM